MFTIEHRRLVEVNTDPQRRCYYGVHAKSEFHWTTWEVLESNVKPERIEFWQDLNDYAVRERGKGAKKEFRLVPFLSEEK